MSVSIPSTMRAVVYDRYGPPERLALTTVPVPRPRAGEVLVKIVATSLNLSDWETLHGDPFYARVNGLFRPRHRILGSDVAGRVVAVGSGVTALAVGDAVFGDILEVKGGFAEYVAAPASALVRNPEALTFAQASAIPQSGAIALAALARAQPGQRMLINGAGGGSGSLAIQLASAAGVHVTGVDNAAKQDFMTRMGADAVFDYRRQDFTRTGPYDLIIDLVAHRSVFSYRRALAPGGTALVVGGTTRALLRMVTVGAAVGAVSGRRLGVLMVPSGSNVFAGLAERCASGEVDIPIDSVFPLEQTADALRRLGEGQALGKIVVTVGDDDA